MQQQPPVYVQNAQGQYVPAVQQAPQYVQPAPQVVYVTQPVVYSEPYYQTRYYRHSNGHRGMAVVGIIAAIIAWGAAGSAWLYTYTGSGSGSAAYESWLYLNHLCVYYYGSFGNFNAGWSCDWTSNVYNSQMIAGMAFLAITGIVACFAAAAGACGTPDNAAPTRGAIFLAVLSFVCSIIGTVCASTGVGAITNLSVPNWGSYYRPGFALAITTCIFTFIFMLWIVALACTTVGSIAGGGAATPAPAPAAVATKDATFAGSNPMARPAQV